MLIIPWQIEELKKRTAYYTTKGLIERYESPSKDPSKTPLGLGIQASPAPFGTPSRQPAIPMGNPDQQGSFIPRTPSPNVPQVSMPNGDGMPGFAPMPLNMTPSMHPSTPQPPALGPSNSSGSGEYPIRVPSKLYTMHPRYNLIQHSSFFIKMIGETASPAKTWVDRLIDLVIGDVSSAGPQNQYALICQQCFTHNGLVPPEMYSLTRESSSILHLPKVCRVDVRQLIVLRN
jgi:hypothetical protein